MRGVGWYRGRLQACKINRGGVSFGELRSGRWCAGASSDSGKWAGSDDSDGGGRLDEDDEKVLGKLASAINPDNLTQGGAGVDVGGHPAQLAQHAPHARVSLSRASVLLASASYAFASLS